MRNTIVTSGVVLSRRPYGEFDLLCVLYTEELGKTPVRFIGVRRPRGKLKALAEPMTHGEYRLYVRPATEWATATGGRIVDSHPGLRLDFEKTCHGLRMCELLHKLVPDRAPNPRKFELIAEFLPALERSGSPWLPLAFGLRLLHLAGFGLAEACPSGEPAELWRVLHAAPLEELERLSDDAARRRLEPSLEKALEQVLDRPLGTTLFFDSLRRVSFTARPGHLEPA